MRCYLLHTGVQCCITLFRFTLFTQIETFLAFGFISGMCHTCVVLAHALSTFIPIIDTLVYVGVSFCFCLAFLRNNITLMCATFNTYIHAHVASVMFFVCRCVLITFVPSAVTPSTLVPLIDAFMLVFMSLSFRPAFFRSSSTLCHGTSFADLHTFFT